MARKITREDLGWNDRLATSFAPHAERGWTPARLLRDNKISYGCLAFGERDFDELDCVLSGKVYHEAATDADLPAVGDWVALDLTAAEAVIRARLPRLTCFSRKASGESVQEQVLVANADMVMVITEPGEDFSLRRLERYLALIQRSGAKPAVVLNKADLHPESVCHAAAEQIRALHAETVILITSAVEGFGLKELRRCFRKGVTVALIGSSGVGKSAIVNEILGEEWQEVGEVNEVTGKGRHTTTARELILLPKGGMLVDNPGIKEVQMWTDECTLRESFADISALTDHCRFRDCKHGSDTGCALRTALASGELDPARFEGFLRLEDEIAELKRKQKKRRMTIERIRKRDHKIKARNREDRLDVERDRLNPHFARGYGHILPDDPGSGGPSTDGPSRSGDRSRVARRISRTKPGPR
ncbi:MAG: ribosome small subunit-dependent GTPase A [Verrucomicrobia bacterium]|nr:ribosome small subunit-dependent GTPase A [Verrucomicrobiota bacterium]